MYYSRKKNIGKQTKKTNSPIILTNTNLNKESEKEKQGILDIRIILNNNQKINIELQMKIYKYWRERSIFYNAKMYTEQGESGDKYNNFIPCIHIGILGFNLIKEKDFHSVVMLKNIKTQRIYSDKLIFHMVELKKLKNVSKENRDALYYWASLIAANSKEEYDILAKQNEYLQEAVNETENS